ARCTMSSLPCTVRRALRWDTRTSEFVKTSDISTKPGGSLLSQDPNRNQPHGRVQLEALHRVLDAPDELPHVLGLDRDEGRDPQLIATQLAVRLGVDDAVG